MFTDPAPTPTRRQVLCGLAAAFLVPAALAACSSDEGRSAPIGGSGGAPAAPGAPLTPLAAVPVGGGVVVEAGGAPVVVVQPTAGQVAAFSAVCPHQGTTVDPPQGGTITCPNHGSTFDGATGALRGGPATTGLAPVPVRVAGDQVVAA